MKLSNFQDISWEEADPKTFLGDAQIKRMLSADSIKVFRVRCEAGARMNWHTHSGSQMLIITEGSCWLQKRGEAKQELKAGDVVLIQAGEEHWHGASQDEHMVHMVVNVDCKTTWGKQVTDEEYAL